MSEPLRRQVLELFKKGFDADLICMRLGLNKNTVKKIHRGLVEDDLLYEHPIEDVLDYSLKALEYKLIQRLNHNTHELTNVEWHEGNLEFNFYEKEYLPRGQKNHYIVTVSIPIDDLEGVQLGELVKLLKRKHKEAERVNFFGDYKAKSGDELRIHQETMLKSYFLEGWSYTHTAKMAKVNKTIVKELFKKWEKQGLRRPERMKEKYFDEPIQ